MTKGEQVRDFFCNKTVADQFVDATTETEMRQGAPYVANIGSGTPVTIRKFTEYWWNKTNEKALLKFNSIQHRDDEVMRYVPSIKSAYF